MNEETKSHEDLVRELNDDALRAEYARPYDRYRAGMVPVVLGWFLVTAGNLIYGKKPSYAKFKAIEVVARIPYQSWEVAAYTLVSAFHGNERYAMRLARTTAFSRAAQDNETMHVVVMSHLARKKGAGWFLHTLVPLLFALVYFWIIFFLYFLSVRATLELNYLFESHAYHQYSEFLEQHKERLGDTPIMSEFLTFYGREFRNEYEFFESVRNDELIHRNRSIREISAHHASYK
jgi:hypothetical protein